MTTVTTPKRRTRRTVTAAEVEAFLRRHPEFFEDHLELLETLKVPHPCGDAVSLIARQIDVLRDKNRRLQGQLNELLQIARDNDALAERLQQFTLTLLNAAGLEDALASLKWGLHEYFQVDFTALRLTGPCAENPLPVEGLYVPSDQWPVLFEGVLNLGKPQCSPVVGMQGEFLFGKEATDAASCALIPLQHAGLRGILAIGSRNPSRFQEGMGALFLTRMGEIVATRLALLLKGQI